MELIVKILMWEVMFLAGVLSIAFPVAIGFAIWELIRG